MIKNRIKYILANLRNRLLDAIIHINVFPSVVKLNLQLNVGLINLFTDFRFGLI